MLWWLVINVCVSGNVCNDRVYPESLDTFMQCALQMSELAPIYANDKGDVKFRCMQGKKPNIPELSFIAPGHWA